MSEMKRCPECGSWEVECGSESPVRDCQCARCLRAQLAEARHDIHAYRGALGYAVPGDHDGRLSDGTEPHCGMCDAMAHELAEARREVELMRITETNWQPIGEQGSDGTYRKFTVVNGSTGYLPAGKYRVIDGELVRVLECPVDDEITALRKDRDRLREQLAVEKIVSRDLRGEVERMRLKWQTGPVPCPGGYLVRVKGMVDAKYLFAGALIECEWAGPIPEPSEGE